MGKGKRVKGARMKGRYGSAYQGPKKIVREGTGQSGGVNIPRYGYPGFRMVETPDSTGMIKAYRGGKCFTDGIIRYPMTADVDPVRAAEAQALADYNSTVGSEGGPCHRADMVRIYGEAYLLEFERLRKIRAGRGHGAKIKFDFVWWRHLWHCRIFYIPQSHYLDFCRALCYIFWISLQCKDKCQKEKQQE